MKSFVALRDERAAPGGAIRLLDAAIAADVSGVMVRNTTILLTRAMQDGGLELTATGNLRRAVVAEMIPCMEWPGFDKADMHRFNRVINEHDFAPLHIVRVVSLAAGLLRAHRGRLVATKSGRGMLPAERGALLAKLLFASFWRGNPYDYGRVLLGGWPRHDIGVVLWSLCVWTMPNPIGFPHDAGRLGASVRADGRSRATGCLPDRRVRYAEDARWRTGAVPTVGVASRLPERSGRCQSDETLMLGVVQ